MNKTFKVDLFVEDRAHESLLKPLIARVAQEEGLFPECQVRSARGGHPRVVREFKLYHQHLMREVAYTPDLLVVAIDSNCSTFANVRRTIEEITDDEYKHMLVCACPDPHIERWYMADLNSFFDVVGYRPKPSTNKCERDYYKQVLENAIQKGDNLATLGGVEFAPELAEKMDLYRAGKSDASLKAFLDELRTKLKDFSRSR